MLCTTGKPPPHRHAGKLREDPSSLPRAIPAQDNSLSELIFKGVAVLFIFLLIVSGTFFISMSRRETSCTSKPDGLKIAVLDLASPDFYHPGLNFDCAGPNQVTHPRFLTATCQDHQPNYKKTTTTAAAHPTNVAHIALTGSRVSASAQAISANIVPIKVRMDMHPNHTHMAWHTHTACAINYLTQNQIPIGIITYGKELRHIDGISNQLSNQTAVEHYIAAYKIINQALFDALTDYPGIIFIAAAGKDKAYTGNINDYPVLPQMAIKDLPNVLAIGTLRRDAPEQPAANYGPGMISLQMPTGQASTCSKMPFFSCYQATNRSGSSITAPFAAHMAARLLQIAPDLTGPQIKQLFIQASTQLADGKGLKLEEKNLAEVAWSLQASRKFGH